MTEHEQTERMLRMLSELCGRPVTLASFIVSFRDRDRAHNNFAVVGRKVSAEDLGRLCGFAESAARDLMFETLARVPRHDVDAFMAGFKEGLRSKPLNENSCGYMRPSASHEREEKSTSTDAQIHERGYAPPRVFRLIGRLSTR